jgi:hypothetical protein
MTSMHTIISTALVGVMSPYPTVVMVTMAQ